MSEPTDNNPPPQGGNEKPWYESAGIAPELVSESVKKYGSLSDYVKGMNEAQELIGGKFPSDKTTPEFNEKFYRAAGRPDRPDEYEFNAPDGIAVKDDTFKGFKESMHKLGLTKKQFGGVAETLAASIKAEQEAWAKQLAEGAAACKAALSAPDAWGDQFEANRTAAMKQMEKLGVLELMQQTGAINRPEVMRAFFAIYDEASGESGTKGGAGAQSIAEQVAALRKDAAYMNPADPRHAEVVKKVNALLDAR